MDVREIYKIIGYISALSVLLPLLAGTIRIKTLNSGLRVLFLYIIICLLVECVGFCLTINNIQDYLLRNIFTGLECTLITYIYFIIFESKITRRIISVFYFVFLCLSAYVLLFKGFTSQDNILSTYESLLFIGLSILYLYNEIAERSIPRLNEYYFFWINSAILIYFGITFFLFLFSGFLEKADIGIYYFFYGLHLLTNILYNFLLSIGLWKIKKS